MRLGLACVDIYLYWLNLMFASYQYQEILPEFCYVYELIHIGWLLFSLWQLWDVKLVNQISSHPAVQRVIALGTLFALELQAEGPIIGYPSILVFSALSYFKIWYVTWTFHCLHYYVMAWVKSACLIGAYAIIFWGIHALKVGVSRCRYGSLLRKVSPANAPRWWNIHEASG